MRYQPQQSVLKPHAGQRQTACMRYISAPQLSQSMLSRCGTLLMGRGSAGSTLGGGFGMSGMAPIIQHLARPVHTTQ